jgi:hypothetical protein
MMSIEYYKDMMRINGELLQHVSDELKDDYEIVNIAVGNNANALRFASNELRDNREIVMKAVKNNPKALKFASIKLRSDREVVMEAIKKSKNGLVFSLYNFSNDNEIMLIIISKDIYNIYLASSNLMNDDNFILSIIRLDKFKTYDELNIIFNEIQNIIKNDNHIYNLLLVSSSKIANTGMSSPVFTFTVNNNENGISINGYLMSGKSYTFNTDLNATWEDLANYITKEEKKDYIFLVLSPNEFITPFQWNEKILKID